MGGKPMSRNLLNTSGNRNSLVKVLGHWWAQRPTREQRLLVTAAGLVGATLLWTTAIAPAWRTVKTYPEQRAALESQLRTMVALQSRAQALREQPAPDARAMQAALRASVVTLGGKGQLQLNSDQATVTLVAVQPEELAQWLARTRLEAHLTPSQAKLQREGSAWSGTLQFVMPSPKGGG